MAEPFFPLTGLSEAQRAQALERFLAAHQEEARNLRRRRKSRLKRRGDRDSRDIAMSEQHERKPGTFVVTKAYRRFTRCAMPVGVLGLSVWDMDHQAREKPSPPSITRSGA